MVTRAASNKARTRAEPDVDMARQLMMKLMDDRDYASRIGQRASLHVRTHFSFRAAGYRYLERINQIVAEREFRPRTETMTA